MSSNNNGLAEGAEQTGSEGGPVPTYRRRPIRWTPDLVSSLCRLAVEVDPTKRRGFSGRLLQAWNTAHPTLPSSAAALEQKLRRVYADTANQARESESETEVEEPMDTNTPTSQATEPDMVDRSLRSHYEKAKGLGPDSLSRRPRLETKWKGDPEVLDRIDRLMCDRWDSLSEKSLWEANCLIYAGAAVAMEQTNVKEDSPEEEEQDDEQLDEADELFIAELMDWEAGTPGERAQEDHEPSEPEEGDRAPQQARAARTTTWLRRVIGWIEAELTRMRGGGS